jgi:serine/threonine protein kinase/tetratricopeptide (TPR) repeat protein
MNVLGHDLDPSPGDVIGSYRILGTIGHGGMGSVYLAERADGELEQKVAIKLLRAGAHHPGWRDRFLRERQLLASLQHPCVVHVMDAGHMADGRPFLVMEHVEGVPIDRYAARIHVKDRLKLFVRVCEGVSYAHRQLIVHRDLKPSNILVDAIGQPKLLDFGIAKLLDESGEVTQLADQLLTPNYASPEQLRGEAQSTATDVYSLGAVLYKLLTGAAPREGVASAPNCEAPPPSRVNPEIPGDLDFVIAKALRPEAEDRYGSAEEFANDIRAVLDRRPVSARSGSGWYRARRYLKRHWLPAAAAAVMVTSLSAGLWVADRERRIAERRFTDVRQLANKLFDIESEIRKLSGGTKVSQFVVDTSLEYLRRLAVEAHGDAALTLELGTAYMRVARVQGVPTARNLGQMEQAEKNLRLAEGLVQSVLASQPRNRTAMLRSAQIAHDRMLLARYNGRYGEAFQLARSSAGWLDRFKPGARDKAELSGILNAYLNIADQFARSEHFEQALLLCRRATDLIHSSGRQDYLPDFLWITSDVHRGRGELDEALSELDEAVRLSDPGTSAETWRISNFAISLICKGELLGEQNAISLDRPAEAIASLERAFELGDGLAHRDPEDQAARSRVANAGIALGGILTSTKPARALAVYAHTLRHLAEVPNNSSFRRFEVSVLAGSSYALWMLGRRAEAKQRLDAAFERLRDLELYPEKPFELGSEVEVSLRALADHEAAAGNLARAVQIYEQLLEEARPAKSGPRTSLLDAVRESKLYRSAAAVEARAGMMQAAAALRKRDRELWLHWDSMLAGNRFVRRHLAPNPPGR